MAQILRSRYMGLGKVSTLTRVIGPCLCGKVHLGGGWDRVDQYQLHSLLICNGV